MYTCLDPHCYCTHILPNTTTDTGNKPPTRTWFLQLGRLGIECKYDKDFLIDRYVSRYLMTKYH